MPEADEVREFEQRFRERAATYLMEPWAHLDHREGKTTHQQRMFWGWFRAQRVDVQGSYPVTELVVIGNAEHDPDCQFGFVLPIWFKDGSESWDGPWKTEWAELAAKMLCYQVFEEAPWTIGIPSRPECDPSADGVTWLAVRSRD